MKNGDIVTIKDKDSGYPKGVRHYFEIGEKCTVVKEPWLDEDHGEVIGLRSIESETYQTVSIDDISTTPTQPGDE